MFDRIRKSIYIRLTKALEDAKRNGSINNVFMTCYESI